MKLLHSWLIAVFLLFHIMMNGQSENAPIVFIYDASGSMWGLIEGETKMSIAARVLTRSVNNLSEDQAVGLVAYGHRKQGDCEDVEFIVPMNNVKKDEVISSLISIKPLGRTPLAFSATQVIEELKTNNAAATIILITDGIESCDGDLCAVIKKAKEDGITLKLHIVGFGLKEEETAALKCAAEAGDGNYYDASDASQLSRVLEEATQETVVEPPKNVLVTATKNGEMIDALIKAFPDGSSTYQTSARTYADTGAMALPAGTYRLEFTALAGSDVAPINLENVVISEDNVTYRTVSFDAGEIVVETYNNGEGWDAGVDIQDPITGKNISGGRTYGRSKAYEVNPGTYTVRLWPMRIKGETIDYFEKNVVVKAKEATNLSHDFQGGTAVIGATHDGNLVDVVVSIYSKDSNKSVSGGRTYTSASSNPSTYLLMPGTYRVTLKGLRDLNGQVREFDMEIRSGQVFERTVSFSE